MPSFRPVGLPNVEAHRIPGHVTSIGTCRAQRQTVRYWICLLQAGPAGTILAGRVQERGITGIVKAAAFANESNDGVSRCSDRRQRPCPPQAKTRAVGHKRPGAAPVANKQLRQGCKTTVSPAPRDGFGAEMTT